MGVKSMKSECWLNAEQSNRGKYRAVCSLYLPQIINSESGRVSINIRQQNHSEKGSMYCVVKCIVRGNQTRVKNADWRHPSCTVLMYRRKSASPVHNVLKPQLHYIYQRFYSVHLDRNIIMETQCSPTKFYSVWASDRFVFCTFF
jgi:hypothetical protein